MIQAPDSALPFLQSACQARAAAGHLLLIVVMFRGQSNAANDFPEPQGRVLLNFTLFVSLAQEILTWSSIILANSPNPVAFCKDEQQGSLFHRVTDKCLNLTGD